MFTASSYALTLWLSLLPRLSSQGVNVINLISSVIYEFSEYARVFVTGKPFSLILTNTLA
jgi:hypothetical protein